MVEVTSYQKDNSSYDVPLLKFLSSLTAKLEAAPQNVEGPEQSLAAGVTYMFRKTGVGGATFDSVKVATLPGMHHEVMLTIPAIMQKTYDMTAASVNKPVKFYVALATHYTDDDVNTLVHKSLYDADTWKNQQILDGLKEFHAKNTRPKTMSAMIVAVSHDKDITLPVAQMQRDFRNSSDEIFDHASYTQSTEILNDTGIKADFYSYADDPQKLSHQLFPLLARAYGIRMDMDDEEGQNTGYLIKDHFSTMEKGEKPERYKGIDAND